MEGIFSIPQDLFVSEGQPTALGKTAVLTYRSIVRGARTKVVLHKNLFSFLLEGQKVVYRPGKVVRINPGQFLMIAGSHVLMSELLSGHGRYSSVVFFFDDSVLTDFFRKYSPVLPGIEEPVKKEPILSFEGDPFIRNYVQSLQLMLGQPGGLTPEMQLLKFDELLLHLVNRDPRLILSFQKIIPVDAGDLSLRAVVESNVLNPVTVEELAFLCHMSLSTFKRKFARLYGTSPNKWLLQQRMELAATLLCQQHEKPSDVYHKVGYENHSSFTQSFKQVYGLTPSEFREQKTLKMDVYP